MCPPPLTLLSCGVRPGWLCVCSGAVWVDMKETGVDVVISAPQKTVRGAGTGGCP